MTVPAQPQADGAPVAGIVLMLVASAMFVGSDSIAKHLSAELAVIQPGDLRGGRRGDRHGPIKSDRYLGGRPWRLR